MYTVTLPGATLTNLTKNGDCYISDTAIGESVFSDLSSVDITDGETGIIENHTDMKLVLFYEENNQYWFAFEEKSQFEKVVSTIEEAIETNSDDLTDVQMALADIYEMILGGM